MRANRARAAIVEQVRLVLGSGSLLTDYRPTGVRLAALSRPNGDITWAAVSERARIMVTDA
jgi:hypothetical protein